MQWNKRRFDLKGPGKELRGSSVGGGGGVSRTYVMGEERFLAGGVPKSSFAAKYLRFPVLIMLVMIQRFIRSGRETDVHIVENARDRSFPRNSSKTISKSLP